MLIVGHAHASREYGTRRIVGHAHASREHGTRHPDCMAQTLMAGRRLTAGPLALYDFWGSYSKPCRLG